MDEVDWYTNGYQHVIEKIANKTGLTEDQVADVYSELSDFNLIDYDIEKDVFYDLIVDGHEDNPNG